MHGSTINHGSCIIFSLNSLASLYAGVIRQLTTGLMGRFGLYILIRPLMVGADVFMLTYFHLDSCAIKTNTEPQHPLQTQQYSP